MTQFFNFIYKNVKTNHCCTWIFRGPLQNWWMPLLPLTGPKRPNLRRALRLCVSKRTRARTRFFCISDFFLTFLSLRLWPCRVFSGLFLALLHAFLLLLRILPSLAKSDHTSVQIKNNLVNFFAALYFTHFFLAMLSIINLFYEN